MILPEFVQNTITHIEHQGFEAFAVGGAVRDYLLGCAPSDWDIATSAPPEDIMRIFGKSRCIPTGLKHGTVTLIAENQMIEITTYRIDGDYADNRHPRTVTFAESITDDLSRRDFTVNALAYNPQNGIVDPFGGIDDLNRKIIRAVGSPEKRFCEDALRIIRGLRFGAVLGFEIEEQTQAAIHQCSGLLKNIARERLQAELSKLVMSDNPTDILTEFDDVFAEFLEIRPDFCKSQWKQNAKMLRDVPHRLSLRLAILLADISRSTSAVQLLRGLKYDNKTIFEVKTILKNIDLKVKPNPICIKHLLSELGEDMLRLVLEARRIKYGLDPSAADNIIEEIHAANQCYLQKDLAIDGNDLIDLGISGAEIGKVLKHLLNEVIEERCPNEKSALTALAKML